MINRILIVLYFFLVFYLVGVLVMENEVNYRTWQWIGEDEFPSYHQALESLLQPFMMIPLTMLLVLSWIIIWLKDNKKVRLLFLVNALLFTAFIVISLSIMVPIHSQLSQEFNTEYIQNLIRYNAMYRTPIITTIAILNTYLLYIFISYPPSKRSEKTLKD